MCLLYMRLLRYLLREQHHLLMLVQSMRMLLVVSTHVSVCQVQACAQPQSLLLQGDVHTFAGHTLHLHSFVAIYSTCTVRSTSSLGATCLDGGCFTELDIVLQAATQKAIRASAALAPAVAAAAWQLQGSLSDEVRAN